MVERSTFPTKDTLECGRGSHQRWLDSVLVFGKRSNKNNSYLSLGTLSDTRLFYIRDLSHRITVGIIFPMLRKK